jgi:single-strand DNA-binding protein
MAGVNKVILLGNLGADPEVRHLEGGSVVANISIATSESYTKNGQRMEQTEWHKVELWDRLAELAEKYLTKGNTVYIEGKIRTNTYQDKEGVTRYDKRIRATNMTFVGGRNDDTDSMDSGSASSSATPAPAEQRAPSPQTRESQPQQSDSDDLPF